MSSNTRNVKRPVRASLLAGAATLAVIGQSAAAQTQKPDTEPEEEEIDVLPTTEQDENAGATIVVTGSRIARDEFDQTAPVSVIDSTVIESSGQNALSDILQRNPAIAVGTGLQNTGDSVDVGAGFISMRGLGVDRSLTLVNGKRRVPGDVTSSTADVNAIPNALVERVEILTGGTSAIYGADAVVGVTNIILKEDFDGLQLSGRMRIPEQLGGGGGYDFDIVGGGNFGGGRGNAVFALTYTKTDRLDGQDRDFSRGLRVSQFRTNRLDTGLNDGIPDRIVVRDVVTATYPATGGFYFFNPNVPFDRTIVNSDQSRLFNSGDPLRFNRFTADENGLRPIQNDSAQCYAVGCFADVRAQGGDGFRFENFTTLISDFERFTSFGRVTYDITPAVQFYGQFDASKIKAHGGAQAPFMPFRDFAIRLTRDNPLLHPSVTAFMDDPNSVIPLTQAQIDDPANNPRLAPITSIGVNRTLEDLGRRTSYATRQVVSAIGGFEGTLFDGWDFDAFYQYGQTKVSARVTNTVYAERLLQAFDVISDPVTGAPVCRDLNARAAGCQPLRALGPENQITDPTFRQWLFAEPVETSKIEQQLAGATVTGSLFDLPAGPVGLDAGVEYRKEEVQFRDDIRRQSLLLQTYSPPEDGDFAVAEVFAETVVPILEGQPFFEKLQVEGAVRYSDYNLPLGSTWTWKAGGVWSPIPDIRFRVSRSRSVRAPTLTDLFSPGDIGAVSPVDPCNASRIGDTPQRAANCAALGIPVGYEDPQIITKRQRTGGNPNLAPETANSLTIGAVLEPRFIPNLSIAVDYWQIDLEGAISTLPLQDLVNACVDAETIDNPFCRLTERFPAGHPNEFQISLVENTFVNFGKREASGVDFNVRYFNDLDNIIGGLPGDFVINVNGTYLHKNNSQPDPDDPDTVFIFAGESALPHWRFNASFSYNLDKLHVNWFTNFRSASRTDNQQAGPESYPEGFDSIPSRIYNDLYVSLDVTEVFQISAGINNVFDVSPPDHPFVWGGGGGRFDSNGRTFLIGARMRF